MIRICIISTRVSTDSFIFAIVFLYPLLSSYNTDLCTRYFFVITFKTNFLRFFLFASGKGISLFDTTVRHCFSCNVLHLRCVCVLFFWGESMWENVFVRFQSTCYYTMTYRHSAKTTHLNKVFYPLTTRATWRGTIMEGVALYREWWSLGWTSTGLILARRGKICGYIGYIYSRFLLLLMSVACVCVWMCVWSLCLVEIQKVRILFL